MLGTALEGKACWGGPIKAGHKVDRPTGGLKVNSCGGACFTGLLVSYPAQCCMATHLLLLSINIHQKPLVMPATDICMLWAGVEQRGCC